MAATDTDQQQWQEIQNVLTNVGMFLSTTLKKERLKKEADKQRLTLMTEVHSALTMLARKHMQDGGGLYPLVTFEAFERKQRAESQRRNPSAAVVVTSSPAPPPENGLLPVHGDESDADAFKTDDNEDMYDEVTITTPCRGNDITIKKQDIPLPQLPAAVDDQETVSALPVSWRRDYKNIYRALWDCKAESKDELGFKRGDFIHIISRKYDGWWIGEKDMQVGLVPSQYLMEAYVKSS